MFKTSGLMGVTLVYLPEQKKIIQKDVEMMEVKNGTIFLFLVSGEVASMSIQNWEVKSVYPQLEGEVE